MYKKARSFMKNKNLTTDEIQQVIELVQGYLTDMKHKWDEQAPESKGWFGVPRDYFLKGTIFILSSIDEMIQFVEGIITSGSDKKETVLLVSDKLLEYIILGNLPMWLKPLSSAIRRIVVNIIISELIDFMVEKYRSGAWKMENNAQ